MTTDPNVTDDVIFDKSLRRVDLSTARLSVTIAAHVESLKVLMPDLEDVPILSDPSPFPLMQLGWLRHLRYL